MRPEIEEIINHLTGTCGTLDEACQFVLGEEFDSTNLTRAESEYIDSTIFCCESCGWWMETIETSEEEPGYCIDCAGNV